MANINEYSFERESVIRGIYYGKYTVDNLPESVYNRTADVLSKSVEKGFGEGEKEMFSDLIDNINMFSSAKTFQQINEMSDMLVSEDGKRLSFEEFKDVATETYDRYNEDWLNTESDTAEWAARSASKWDEFEKEGNPYLMYVAEIDDSTCIICEPLDGILIDQNDSFWDDNATPQHFDCRCRIERVDGIEVSEPSLPTEIKDSVVNKRKRRVSTQQEINNAVSKSQEHKNPLFNYNPGKMRVIFKDKGMDKHPYFDIPDKFKKLAENNFNLPIPKKLN